MKDIANEIIEDLKKLVKFVFQSYAAPLAIVFGFLVSIIYLYLLNTGKDLPDLLSNSSLNLFVVELSVLVLWVAYIILSFYFPVYAYYFFNRWKAKKRTQICKKDNKWVKLYPLIPVFVIYIFLGGCLYSLSHTLTVNHVYFYFGILIVVCFFIFSAYLYIKDELNKNNFTIRSLGIIFAKSMDLFFCLVSLCIVSILIFTVNIVSLLNHISIFEFSPEVIVIRYAIVCIIPIFIYLALFFGNKAKNFKNYLYGAFIIVSLGIFLVLKPEISVINLDLKLMGVANLKHTMIYMNKTACIKARNIGLPIFTVYKKSAYCESIPINIDKVENGLFWFKLPQKAITGRETIISKQYSLSNKNATLVKDTSFSFSDYSEQLFEDIRNTAVSEKIKHLTLIVRTHNNITTTYNFNYLDLDKQLPAFYNDLKNSITTLFIKKEKLCYPHSDDVLMINNYKLAELLPNSLILCHSSLASRNTYKKVVGKLIELYRKNGYHYYQGKNSLNIYYTLKNFSKAYAGIFNGYEEFKKLKSDIDNKNNRRIKYFLRKKSDVKQYIFYSQYSEQATNTFLLAMKTYPKNLTIIITSSNKKILNSHSKFFQKLLGVIFV